MAVVDNFQCCALSKAYDALLSSRQGRLSKKQLFSSALFNYQVRAVFGYNPPGALLSEGFVASATLDLSAFSAFGVLMGSITVAGSVIAVLPQGTYANIGSLITGLVSAINNAPTPYTATDSGGGTITIETSDPTAQANGFEIVIQINPTFSMVEELQFDNTTFRQPIQINDPDSINYQRTLIAKLGTAGQSVEVFKNRTFEQSVFIGNNGVWGAYAIAHQQSADRVWTAAFLPGGVFTVLNPNFTINNLYPSGAGAGWGIYNTFNNCLYFAATSTNRVIKIDSAGVQTNIGSVTGVTKLAFDPGSGTVWGIGTQSLFLIHPTTNVVTPVATVGENPVSINYWPVADLMLVAFKNIGVIRTYDMAGGVDTATFYSLVSVDTVFYSSIYNLIFAATTTATNIVLEDGSLLQNLSVGAAEFLQDEVSNDVIGVFSAGGVGFVRYFALGNDGEESFDGALENGVDPVYSDGSENCLTPAEQSDAVQLITTDCLTCNDTTTASVIPPSGNSYTIYFGNSSDDALDAAGVGALTSIIQSGYAATYSFDATSPSEYKYIAWPSLLGTPSRFYDPSTGFDVPVNTLYFVTINSIQYTVARSFYALGGAIDITIQS